MYKKMYFIAFFVALFAIVMFSAVEAKASSITPPSIQYVDYALSNNANDLIIKVISANDNVGNVGFSYNLYKEGGEYVSSGYLLTALESDAGEVHFSVPLSHIVQNVTESGDYKLEITKSSSSRSAPSNELRVSVKVDLNRVHIDKCDQITVKGTDSEAYIYNTFGKFDLGSAYIYNTYRSNYAVGGYRPARYARDSETFESDITTLIADQITIQRVQMIDHNTAMPIIQISLPQNPRLSVTVSETNKDNTLDDKSQMQVETNTEPEPFTIESLADVTDIGTAVTAVQLAIDSFSAEQLNSDTSIDHLTIFAEEAVAQSAKTTVEGSNIVVNYDNTQSLINSASATKQALENTIRSSGIETMREISTDVKFNTTVSQTVQIVIEPSAASANVDNIRVETPDFSISLSKELLQTSVTDSNLYIMISEVNPTNTIGAYFKAPNKTGKMSDVFYSQNDAKILGSIGAGTNYLFPMLLNSKVTVAAINQNSGKQYAVVFSEQLVENAKVSLDPDKGDPTYQAVLKSDGTPVGGKYNPITRKMDVKITDSDTYTVKDNKKNFIDISKKSKEMQEAIQVLASKGIFVGSTESRFVPDRNITRAEVASIVVKALSKYKLNADGGFVDVKKTDWYFAAAGSAKKYGIMSGFTDNTFRGSQTVLKNQMVVIAANALVSEMKYKLPSNPNMFLTYSDSDTIAGWAAGSIALATRENLVVKRADNKFASNTKMTRGDAAIILYRLFNKIW